MHKFILISLMLILCAKANANCNEQINYNK